MDALCQAFADATLVWQDAVAQLPWQHWLLASAYLGAAWFCLLNSHIARTRAAPHRSWLIAALLLCVLGLNTVLYADLFATQWVRTLARLQGWYGGRRPLQYALVALLTAIMLRGTYRSRNRFQASEVPLPSVALGLATLLLILALRTVSAHGTDAVLNLQWLGVSAGRLAEWAAIAFVVRGAIRALRLH